MPFTLQQLSDVEDIKQLKHRYFRSIDTGNEADLTSVFTEDVTIDYRGGGYRAKLQGRQNMNENLLSSFVNHGNQWASADQQGLLNRLQQGEAQRGQGALDALRCTTPSRTNRATGSSAGAAAFGGGSCQG